MTDEWRERCVVKGCNREVEPDADLGVCEMCCIRIANRHRQRILAEDQRERQASRNKFFEAAKAKRARDSSDALWSGFEAGFKQPEGTSFVYYVDCGNYIKIGYTTRVRDRLRALRIPVEGLLALEPGGFLEEQDRHAEFEHLRITKRWENFRPEPDLMQHIAALRERYGLPQWLHAPPRRGKNGPITVRRIAG